MTTWRDVLEKYGPIVQEMFAAANNGQRLTEDELEAFFDPATPTPDLDKAYKAMLFPGMEEGLEDE